MGKNFGKEVRSIVQDISTKYCSNPFRLLRKPGECDDNSVNHE
jgi:hypothetical protein